MPTLKRYQDSSGYYLHARVDGSVVTFQTTKKAEQVFEELGYKHGSSVSWQLIGRLQDEGAIYTNKSGVDDTIPDEVSELSAEKRSLLKEYFGDEQSFIEIKDQLAEQVGVSKNSDEFDRILSELESVDHSGAITSLRAFQDVPYELVFVSTNEGSIIYEYEVESEISLTCADKRWVSDEEIDFAGRIEYPDWNVSFSIENGYISTWESTTGLSHPNDDSLADRHKTAIEQDARPRSLGFTIENWTELLRRVFVFVRNYDIRPHDRGHRGLVSIGELEGKHIWVKPTQTTSTSKHKLSDAGRLIENSEMKNIVLSEKGSEGWMFVEVEKEPNNESHQASHHASLGATKVQFERGKNQT